MMKCDMCYDRTSVGSKPMCAIGLPESAPCSSARARRSSVSVRVRGPSNTFRFGSQIVTTKVHMMVPLGAVVQHIDVTAALRDEAVDPTEMLANVFEGIGG